MTSSRLIQSGFYSSDFKNDFPEYFDEKEFDRKRRTDKKFKYKDLKWKEFKDKLITNLEDGKEKKKIYEYADHDEAEVAQNQMMLLDWPKPEHRYSLILETPHKSIEPVYFWCINLLKDLGCADVLKVTDLFAAAEHSSFYGAGMQRLGMAQDKVQQFLAQIGQFVKKDLFQLVRDIRWIDERLEYHENARSKEIGITEPAEITLKGLWTDLVDGVVQGQRVSANVFQMAQQLQFTALPDFFFSLHPKTVKEIGLEIEKLGLKNKPLTNVLKRKLEQYLVWKEYNYTELKQRKRFELSYLRQHYNIIKMYMTWLKPYLKHASRLETDVKSISSPELIASFEGSMVEIEVIGKILPEGNKDTFTCLMLTFEYRTRPSLSFTQEGGYHRGPVHIGETKITWRSYSWTQQDIDKYLSFKEKEDIEVLSQIDESMHAIGDDLQRYLDEAKEIGSPRNFCFSYVNWSSMISSFLCKA